MLKRSLVLLLVVCGVSLVFASVAVAGSSAGFGLASFEGSLLNANGTVDTQAGSHPYALTFGFSFNTAYNEKLGYEAPIGQIRNMNFNLPPGLIGNPQAVSQCTRKTFDKGGEEFVTDGAPCPASSEVGVNAVHIGSLGGYLYAPVFNLVPPPGVAAQFGFTLEGNNVFLDVGVRSGGDNGLTVHVDNLPQHQIISDQIVIWGTPADHEGTAGTFVERGGAPFLTLPTSCGAPLRFTAEALGTWGNPNLFSEKEFLMSEGVDPPLIPETEGSWHPSEGGPAVGLTGCERLAHFNPVVSIAPDTSQGDTPAGLTTTVRMPQGLNPEGLATAGLKDTTVVLPEGIAVNPGQAKGLATCPLAQAEIGSETGDEGPPSCPAASKVGEDEVVTPLLAEPLKGSVYLLPSNPPDVKILLAASGEGINLKLVGTVQMNEATGQLTTTFENTPDAPLTDYKLSFSGGAQAALVTPSGCGVYGTSADFTPWSTPFAENALVEGNFTINSGPDGSPCASPLPFSPVMNAGASTDQAGGYTDFSMLLTRGDGQQRISKLKFKTPPGLLGMISHVSLCEEPQAAKGECPASSLIGHTVVGAGSGPYQLYIPEEGQPPAPIYITGPYEGAPYGLVIAVPVLAGPFNLGTTVVRGKIEVDPVTSQLTITTDPLPTILDGVPTDLRTIDAVIDRKEFMFNPTNCNPSSFSGTATSVEGTEASLSSPFQVGSCRSLTFKPGFKVSTSAKTSRTEGASLHVTMTLPDEGGLSSTANVQRVKVSLPKQLPSPLKTLQKACLEKTFAENPKSCPVASQVGTVKVSTPVLPGGLSGTAYFVSHGGAKYPELIMVLAGQNGVTVQVHGETQISKAGITTAVFATVPDVPFSSFELTLPQREYPALTANGSLCKGTLLMPTELVGQNGLVINQSTKIAVTGCPKAKRVKHKRKAQARARVKQRKKG